MICGLIQSFEVPSKVLYCHVRLNQKKDICHDNNKVILGKEDENMNIKTKITLVVLCIFLTGIAMTAVAGDLVPIKKF